MLKQNTPEWLEMRKHHLGASDAPVIMGVSPWTTPYQLWEEKLDLRPSRPMNWGMERGQSMEPVARQELEKMTGLVFSAQVKFHATIPWMMASLDAIDPHGAHIAEIKCPGKEDHEQALAGALPEKYIPQIQHQLEVCELEMGYYFSFDGKAGVLLKIYRDDKYINKMLQKEREFWERLQNIDPPELSDRDYEPIEDPERLQLAQELLEIRSQLNPLEKREKEIEAALKAATTRNAIGGGIKISRYLRKGNVDYNQIPELDTINLELYRKKPIEYFKISLTKG